jgi:hypothetical protein
MKDQALKEMGEETDELIKRLKGMSEVLKKMKEKNQKEALERKKEREAERLERERKEKGREEKERQEREKILNDSIQKQRDLEKERKERKELEEKLKEMEKKEQEAQREKEREQKERKELEEKLNQVQKEKEMKKIQKEKEKKELEEKQLQEKKIKEEVPFRASLKIDESVRSFFLKDVLKHWSDKAKLGEILYQGSVDGFASSAFHSKCDNKGPTLVIVRSEFNKVFGGFASVSWQSSSSNSGYQSDDHSILFSFDLKKVFPLKPEKKGNALYFNSSYGPIFGSGGDLYISSNCNNNTSSAMSINSAYSFGGVTGNQIHGNPDNNSTKFKVSEYLVYSVKKE